MGFEPASYSPDGFIGQGVVKIGILDTSYEYDGLIDMGYVDDFSWEPPEIETLELISNRDPDNPGEIVQELTKSRKWPFSFSTLSHGLEQLKLAFYGEESSVTQAAATVTAEDVTLVLDQWVPLAKRNLSTATEDAPLVSHDTTDYTEGTHYVIDYWSGQIKALTVATGGIDVENNPHDVDYSALETTYDQVTGGSVSDFEAYVEIRGHNLSKDVDFELIVPRASLKPAEGAKFVTDDFGSLKFECYAMTLSGEDGPFYYREFSS